MKKVAPASETGNTDKLLIKAQVECAIYKIYVLDFRNFPGDESPSEYIFNTIKKHEGITTKELIRVLGLPKTTIYDHVKYLVENERSDRKVKGQLRYWISSQGPGEVRLPQCYSIFFGPASSRYLE